MRKSAFFFIGFFLMANTVFASFAVEEYSGRGAYEGIVGIFTIDWAGNKMREIQFNCAWMEGGMSCGVDVLDFKLDNWKNDASSGVVVFSGMSPLKLFRHKFSR